MSERNVMNFTTLLMIFNTYAEKHYSIVLIHLLVHRSVCSLQKASSWHNGWEGGEPACMSVPPTGRRT
jgi:hypothetical protein